MIVEHFEAGVRQFLVEPPHSRVAVLEVAGHGPLARVEVERFRSDGRISGDEMLETLFREFSD